MIEGEKMLAEVYGKISRTGSNLSERLEDELTGNVFGTLRYISFSEGLQQILQNAIFPSDIKETIKQIHLDEWSSHIQFWPYDTEGELDVYLEFDDVAIGIEVKYHSGLSSDDGADYSDVDDEENETKNSSHQLQRETRIISRKGAGKQKILIFIADAMSCVDVYADVQKRKLLCKTDVAFGYISWQSFLRELRNLKFDNYFNNVMVNDLIALLVKKRFEHFDSMELKDDCVADNSNYYRFYYHPKQTFDFKVTANIEGSCYYEFS